ncbi:odorant receptor 131-2-like [Rhinoderma darwinii]|uniref:odorant receptor 131-2-like n=1 Tax=Rhinoderma darwinii TaxID=43563 RepID=UPI003F67255D
MENLFFVRRNVTRDLQVYDTVDDITRTVFLILTLLCFTFFVYIISVLLKVFFTTPPIWENSRYVLFVHMLLNDTLYLAMGNLIVLSIMYSVYIPMPICYMLHTLAACSFRVTPYNLAAMSLERYVAICFPFRHFDFCNVRRARSAIVVIWLIGFSPSIADFTIIIYSTKNTFYSLHMLCDRSVMTIDRMQEIIRSIIYIFSFTSVALIILFTYSKVMLVARRFGSGGSSAVKAGKTVMLHALQLLLCMVSFLSTVTLYYFPNCIPFFFIFNFLMFTCLPRLLSPLIYGIRDDVFNKYIKKLYSIK